MRLSRAGYYADFVVYPTLVAGMFAYAAFAESWMGTLKWCAAFVCGLTLWTLLEYFFHRVLFHEVPVFDAMHDAHHLEPVAMIGTPTWISLSSIVLGSYLPVWAVVGPNVASGATAGIMLGYLWYISVHHASHHWRAKPNSYLFWAKHRHALHHFAEETCNFGVTSGFWDRVFGTAFEAPRRRERRSASQPRAAG
jgi:sterol desaturase/sphingolipid hydroxylase (fatty acid hydroxylase superfamily)